MLSTQNNKAAKQISAEQLPIETREGGGQRLTKRQAAEIIKKRFSRFLRNRSLSKPAKVACAARFLQSVFRLEDAIRARAKASYKEHVGGPNKSEQISAPINLPQKSAKGLVPIETREERAKANQVRKPSDSVQQKSAEQKLPIEILEGGVRGAAFTVRPLARGPASRKK